MTDTNPTPGDETTGPSDSDHEVPEGGTAAGSPVEGAQISEAEAERAVEPDDNAYEVDGPQAGHA